MVTDASERFFDTSDGPRIHFREYRPNGPENGVAVLCLHGLTRNERDFEELAPMIADLGRRVIVPSQRGRGRSDWDPHSERYSPAVYAADMLALLDHLGIDKAVFVGTSMGGLITMIAAALAPHRVFAAVLNDVGPEIDPAGLAKIRSYVGSQKTATSWAAAADICRDINGLAFPEQDGSTFWSSLARRTFVEKAPDRIELDYDPQISRSLVAIPGAPPDLWPIFGALISIPTLVLRGELTDILMATTVAEMQQRKPDLAVTQVRAVGHAPFMTEPDAWQALRAFLIAAG